MLIQLDIAMLVQLWRRVALIKLSKYGSADEDPEFLQKTKRKNNNIRYSKLQLSTVNGEKLMGGWMLYIANVSVCEVDFFSSLECAKVMSHRRY
jgi:hypothetical protein